MKPLVGLIALAACGGDPVDRPLVFGGDRSITLDVPETLVDGQRYPLLLVLHGYTVTGFIQQAYLGAAQLATRSEAFVLAPDGLLDLEDKPFWNADEVCCDYDQLAPDDVGYLGGLLDDVAEAWPVDRDAVFAVGHGNGGHMAYRLACERADALAGIAVIAAGTGFDAAECAPSQPVNVVHLHGTADLEFELAGGGPFQQSPGAPGAVESVSRWADHGGCSRERTPRGAIDVDDVVDGAET
ncbi:MAG: hypothetical protein H0V17_14385, partial [Deltaproteobacteria bacterium]|nr:hypothetical protein [Deltaproteobacteria bacterium]